jgi:hypothetical protein
MYKKNYKFNKKIINLKSIVRAVNEKTRIREAPTRNLRATNPPPNPLGRQQLLEQTH